MRMFATLAVGAYEHPTHWQLLIDMLEDPARDVRRAACLKLVDRTFEGRIPAAVRRRLEHALAARAAEADSGIARVARGILDRLAARVG